MKRLSALWAALFVTLACAFTADSFLAGDAGAHFTYRKCGPFKYKGKHLLFTHRFPCAKAEGKAKYVLRHRHHPPHWNCSLAELSSGFAACHRGSRAWEFVPR